MPGSPAARPRAHAVQRRAVIERYQGLQATGAAPPADRGALNGTAPARPA